MKFYLVVIMLLSTSILRGQLHKYDILYPSKEDKISQAKRIMSLRRKAILLFAFRKYTSWSNTEPYTIIALMKDSSFRCYKLSMPNLRLSQNTNTDKLKYKLSLVYSYNLFSMRNTDNWQESCEIHSPSCGDCTEYDFVLMTKRKMKRLYFYEPTLYVNSCSLVNENKRIIDFIKELWN